MNKPLILVTNDDGVYARGIAELIEAIKNLGEIIVVAPEKSFSAKSHSVTMEYPIYLKKLKEEENLTIYSSSGTPSDCVKLAIHEVLDRKPDIIVSGINHGSNSSTSIVYSGTMAAAIEGTLNHINSIGFSLASYDSNADFSPTRHYANEITRQVLENKLPEGICLNVNFPAVQHQEIKGIKICRQAKAFWEEEFVKKNHPRGFEYYWLTGEFVNSEPKAEDTDEWALKNNFVSVVPITIDFTAHKAIDTLKKWKFNGYS